jgi:guanylate kinase
MMERGVAEATEESFRVVVLSGPSGSGKTTVVERLVERSSLRLMKSVSATTRAPRAGERPGDAYYFLSPDDFATRRARGEFLETAEVYAGLWYGTLKSEVERARSAGRWSLLEIDVQGAFNVMGVYPDAITVFLKPPSMEVCEQRLRARGTETEAIIQRRLRKVAEELSYAPRYRYQVVNDDVDRAVAEIVQILEHERNS